MTDKGYVHPELLWSPAELQARLGDANLRVVDVRTGEEYANGHIPGAIHFDLYGISLNDTSPAPLEAFTWMWGYLLEVRGIGLEHTVVFCEETSAFKAARGFWFLEYLGHTDVHVLDGGLRAWRAAGLPLTQEATPPKRKPFAPSRRPDLLATYREVQEAIGKPDKAILDTRTDDEWNGKWIRAARPGAVPGAVHLEWTNNLDAAGAFKPAAELRAMYEAKGITPDKEVIPYCQGGYRSAHAYLALRLLGYPRVRNYLGSWKEWGDKTQLPIVEPWRKEGPDGG
jgi:thiosulfate/3-mercaptopyruvate sulfurtransferase